MRSFIAAKRLLIDAIEEAKFLGKSTEAMREALEELSHIEQMTSKGRAVFQEFLQARNEEHITD